MEFGPKKESNLPSNFHTILENNLKEAQGTLDELLQIRQEIIGQKADKFIADIDVAINMLKEHIIKYKEIRDKTLIDFEGPKN